MLEYASPVSCLYSTSDISHLESIQRRATCWVCGSRWNPTNQTWTKSSDFCLQELRWPTLQARRNYFSVSFVHDILHKRVSLFFKDHFSTSCTQFHHLTLTISPIYHPPSILIAILFLSTHLFYGTQFHSRSSNYPTTLPFVLHFVIFYHCLK